MRLLTPLLLLLVAQSNGQEEDNANSDDDAEEAWKFVEFLKTDINGNIEDILQKTLYEARDKRGDGVVEETITRTMEQVMDIREKILKRIKDIRKKFIQIDLEQNIKQEQMLSEFRMEIMSILLKIIDGSEPTVEKLKEISKFILRFKLSVNNEVMRLLILPKSGKAEKQPVVGGDCTECDILAEFSYKVENIVVCAEQDQPIEDIDLPTDQQGINRPDEAEIKSKNNKPEPGVFCEEPNMYVMELILCNDNIDSEIKNLYNKLVVETDDKKRQVNKESLDFFKSVRNSIDEVIAKLMPLTDATQLKKVVTRSLGQASKKLKSKLNKCKSKCGPEGCDSCAADIIYDSIAKMNDYAIFFENTEDDKTKQDFVRVDMIKFINENNAKTMDILIKKATVGKIDRCENDKLEIFDVVKQPFWMLVNTTIQAEGSTELEIMVGTMIEILSQELQNYCGNTETQRKGNEEEGPRCDREEYQQIKKYLVKVDEIIQDSLFKESDDSSKLDAVLGFVDIQSMFDKRVKKLFEDQLVCPQEVTMIKKQYMVQLNRCMAQFMNKNIQFSNMSRIQRISCTKEMRKTMEERVAKLLQKELEDTFSQLDTEVPDFLLEDGPITDIDIPNDQQGVSRPA